MADGAPINGCSIPDFTGDIRRDLWDLMRTCCFRTRPLWAALRVVSVICMTSDKLIPQNLVTFVLLQFSPDPQSQGLSFLLAGPQPGKPLEITLPGTWQKSLSPQDQDYLAALIDEWENTPPERVSDLLEQLVRLSHGPLRAIDSKATTLDKYLSLKRMIDGQAYCA